jgi:hypothetical protein
MHRIPKSPIGLLICKNRFRVIGEELTEVVAALHALRADYEALEAPGGQVDLRGVAADLDRQIDTLTERAAVMRGMRIVAVGASSRRGTALPRILEASNRPADARDADLRISSSRSPRNTIDR